MTAPTPAPSRRRTASPALPAAERAATPLRVVEGEQGPGRDRRRRRRVLAVLGVVVVAATVFGLVASHVALTQGQFELQRLQARADAEQARYERLRLQVAELESPARIVAAAQERLGMVPPPGVTYLSPSGPVSDGAGPRRPPKGRTEAAAPADAGTDDWSSVKSQLSSRP